MRLFIIWKQCLSNYIQLFYILLHIFKSFKHGGKIQILYYLENHIHFLNEDN